jgi:CheY-like chemotaxis protein
MIPLAKNNELVLKPIIINQMLEIQAVISRTMPLSKTEFPSFDLHPSIEVARRLIEKAGGSLCLASGEYKAEVCFSIPTLAQVPVLVIDDNPDTIQLFQRYVQGSRYSVVGIQEPAETIRLVDQIRPRVIVMDVMMPELDGWDLLIHLRQDQQIRDVAILICSILPQEVLARSLGADGFLQKPVLPQDFLNALDRLIDPPPLET